MKNYIKPLISETSLNQNICKGLDIPWLSIWDEIAVQSELPEMPTN